MSRAVRVFTVGLTVLLAGCPFVSTDQFAEVQDVDGDGVVALRFGGADCDDGNPAIRPDAEELWYDGIDQNCDGADDYDQDFDGVPRGEDCDDTDATKSPGLEELCDGFDNDCDGRIDDDDTVDEAVLPVWFLDADGDGFGAGASVFRCEAPPSHVAFDGDCDDGNDLIAPDQVESCDAADRNCDGDPTAGSFDTVAHYPDADGDGFGDADEPIANVACEPPAGFVANRLDCDDSDPDAADPQTPWFEDVDGDGFGDPATEILACTAPPGRVPVGEDCNDAVAAIRPGATETCNTQDDDCDGDIDEGAQDASIFFLDGDGDGFGVQEVLACTPSPGIAVDGGDCNDADPLVRPGAVEICGDGVLQDCNVTIDDCDGDGDPDSTDCGDADPEVNSAATELCDGVDNDCDGLTDSQDDDVVLSDVQYFLDTDGDGFGSNTLVGAPSCDPPANGASQVGDCDDDDPDVFPGRLESCDGIDNDCNGAIDDGQPSDPPTFFRDADLDGYGVQRSPSRRGVKRPDSTGRWCPETATTRVRR